MKRTVSCLKGRTFGTNQLSVGIVQRGRGQGGVQFGKGVTKPSIKHDLPVVVSLGIRSIRRDVRTVEDLPT